MALETSPDSPAPLRQISGLLGGYIGRLGAVWVEAEVAQLNRRPGVCFLTLRDLEATISISGTCHSSVLDASPGPITEGSRVVVHAKPDFYQPNGRLALAVREIRPAGEGELLAQLERRKRLLAAEGLFDPAVKRPPPLLPGRIGLITAEGSAAERDVVENARLRWPDAPFRIRYALMQGPQSARQVIEALKLLDDDPAVDVIVVARGGGGVEDLLPFSDEALIRAVHALRTPVVSAIGHEPDVPLLDLVADVRASTPTDAAERIVPDVREQLQALDRSRRRARQAIRGLVEREQHALTALRSRPVLAKPATLVDQQQSIVDAHRERALRSATARVDRAADEIGHHLARVRALSPLNTLQRGYAVAIGPDGRPVTRTDQARPGDALRVRLTDGTLTARVESIEEHHHEH